MAVIASIDGPNRLIYLSAATVGVDLQPMDVYKEMRALRRTDENLRKYDVFLRAYGNVSKGGGKYTERYVVCIDGTRIVPYDAIQELVVVGVIITDDGQEGISCFDRSPIINHVDIAYVPPQVEVIVIEVGGSALTPEQTVQLENIYRALNLDPTKPVEVTPALIKSGDIEIDIEGDGETYSKFTRRP